MKLLQTGTFSFTGPYIDLNTDVKLKITESTRISAFSGDIDIFQTVYAGRVTREEYDKHVIDDVEIVTLVELGRDKSYTIPSPYLQYASNVDDVPMYNHAMTINIGELTAIEMESLGVLRDTIISVIDAHYGVVTEPDIVKYGNVILKTRTELDVIQVSRTVRKDANPNVIKELIALRQEVDYKQEQIDTLKEVIGKNMTV